MKRKRNLIWNIITYYNELNNIIKQIYMDCIDNRNCVLWNNKKKNEYELIITYYSKIT